MKNLIALIILNAFSASARQPLLEDDGLVIHHRGFNEVVQSAYANLEILNKTNQATQEGVKKILEQTENTIAAIPKILTSAEFMTRAGIKVVGISFCLGGAHWIWDGANNIMEGYSPIEKKSELQARLRRKNKARTSRHQSRDLSAPQIASEISEDDELAAHVTRTQARQQYKRGAIKIFAGFVSLSIGCYAMFRTENIARLFGAPH